MRDGAGRNERVIGPRGGFAARSTQRCSDTPKCPRTLGVERKNLEIRLCLLQVLLPRTTFRIRLRHIWPDGQLSEGYRTDHGFVWQLVRIRQAAEQNHRGRVEHAS